MNVPKAGYLKKILKIKKTFTEHKKEEQTLKYCHPVCCWSTVKFRGIFFKQHCGSFPIKRDPQAKARLR